MPSVAPSPPNLPQIATVLDRSRYLCLRAQLAVDAARRTVAASREHTGERLAWRELWADTTHNPDHLLVCCVYCGRSRARDGNWVALPHEIESLIRGWSGLCLSHGICSSCLKEYGLDREPHP